MPSKKPTEQEYFALSEPAQRVEYRAMRHAICAPFFSSPRGIEAVRWQMRELIKLRRARMELLTRCPGAFPSLKPTDWAYWLYCPVAGFWRPRDAHYRNCRQRDVCPFCWARQIVLNTYRRFMRFYFGEDDEQTRRHAGREDPVLAYVKLRQFYPADVDVRQALGRAVSARSRHFRELRLVHGAWLTTFEPLWKTGQPGWLQTDRVLGTLPPGEWRLPLSSLSLSPECVARGSGCELLVHRKTLARCAAQLGRFPSGMLKGDLAEVGRFLQARRGLRLLAHFGKLRGAGREEPE